MLKGKEWTSRPGNCINPLGYLPSCLLFLPLSFPPPFHPPSLLSSPPPRPSHLHFSSSIKCLLRFFKTLKRIVSTEESLQCRPETLSPPSHTLCRIVNFNISTRFHLNFGGVSDYDLQRRGDRKQLFLEAVKEIIQNGLYLLWLSTSIPGCVVGVGVELNT